MITELRKFGPLKQNSPIIGKECPACKHLFKLGDLICLVPVGPGEDVIEQEKCREGKVYNSVAIPVHWTCATGKSNKED
ncbi:MAG: hypothetical protein WC444_06060 [Candidatus Paceibacterota bacterium]